MTARLRIAIMISGTGSNMLAIHDACRSGSLAADVVGVISDKPQAPGLAKARDRGLHVEAIPVQAGDDRRSHGDRLLAALRRLQPQVVVLAGYMRILSDEFVNALNDRLLNIHPSLLPKYKGLHTHKRVLEAGDAVHGATVHYVTPDLDCGPPVLQGRIKVHRGEPEATLVARIHRAEHVIYPTVLSWLAEGRLQCVDGVPMLDGQQLEAPIVQDFEW